MCGLWLLHSPYKHTLTQQCVYAYVSLYILQSVVSNSYTRHITCTHASIRVHINIAGYPAMSGFWLLHYPHKHTLSHPYVHIHIAGHPAVSSFSLLLCSPHKPKLTHSYVFTHILQGILQCVVSDCYTPHTTSPYSHIIRAHPHRMTRTLVI